MITSILPLSPVVGQSVNVSYSVGGGQNPGGSVSVLATTGETCSGTVGAGQCTLSFSTAASRSLTATYGGDGNNGASSSQSTSLTISAASTTLSLVSALPDPSVVNVAVTVTASVNVVAPGSGVPSGTVVISAPDSAGCTILLPATTCTLTFTTSGSKAITAHYSGSPDFLASLAAPLAHTVNGLPGIDLAISIEDAVSFAQSSQLLTYLITVQNIGAVDSHNAMVQDILPANLSNATWTCAPVGANASCAASGTGNILDLINLPTATAVIFQLTATVVPLPEGPVIQAAAVSAGAGETDSNPSNNIATDTDVVGIFADSFDPP
jgi:uncharacterized repeat protein (TIGR01451 family)